ncbi:hypothetical protein G6O67_003395 [Ophiocordyceps sinensis]|uniref:Uncharacterized protein n=1 Tax=Ophiocordyceps sinensis TaxID=72228 RepID=A0A8H4PW84_9HYPO|nr:hypothetical protein G6O67_003395 [Ophiocordyceps sinensis]
MKGDLSSQASIDEGQRKRTVKMADQMMSLVEARNCQVGGSRGGRRESFTNLAARLKAQTKKPRGCLTAALGPTAFRLGLPLAMWEEPLLDLSEPPESAMARDSSQQGVAAGSRSRQSGGRGSLQQLRASKGDNDSQLRGKLAVGPKRAALAPKKMSYLAWPGLGQAVEAVVV